MSDQNPNRGIRRKIAGERKRGSTSPAPAASGGEGGPDSPDEPSPGIASPPAQPPADLSESRAAAPSSGRDDSAAQGAGGGAVTSGAPRSFPNWLLVGLAAMLVAVVGVDVAFAVKDAQQDELAETRSESLTSAYNTAPAQAEEAAAQILGYDYKTLRQDADEAKAFMTPSYAETFQKTVDGLLTAPAEQVRAHVEAKVMASGVASAEANEVEIMLFIDQTSATTANGRPQTHLNRVVFTMVKSGDRWLVNEITAL